MMGAATAASTAVGNRMLGEIEETTLDEVLTSLRASLAEAAKQRRTGLGGVAGVAGVAGDAHGGGTSGSSAAGTTGVAPAAIAGASASASTRSGFIGATSRWNPKLKKKKTFPIPALDGLVARHLRTTQSPVLSVSGRHLPLLYLLVATLIASPHSKAVAVVDLEGRFDVTRVLQCTPFPAKELSEEEEEEESVESGGDSNHPTSRPPEVPKGESKAKANAKPKPRVFPADLAHIHVHRPARSSSSQAVIVRDAVAAMEQHMLYGNHGSAGREWWGTMVVGVSGSGSGLAASGPPSATAAAAVGLESTAGGSVEVDVTGGWKGWLRVEREEVGGFGLGVSAEEALRDRERRNLAVGQAGWHALSVWGGFSFRQS